jgi:hypothetical protein
MTFFSHVSYAFSYGAKLIEDLISLSGRKASQHSVPIFSSFAINSLAILAELLISCSATGKQILSSMIEELDTMMDWANNVD